MASQFTNGNSVSHWRLFPNTHLWNFHVFEYFQRFYVRVKHCLSAYICRAIRNSAVSALRFVQMQIPALTLGIHYWLPALHSTTLPCQARIIGLLSCLELAAFGTTTATTALSGSICSSVICHTRMCLPSASSCFPATATRRVVALHARSLIVHPFDAWAEITRSRSTIKFYGAYTISIRFWCWYTQPEL